MRRFGKAMLLVFLIITAGSVALFAQSPALSGPNWLPGNAAIGAAAGQQDSPVIVRGGNQFLAVWVDSRSTYNQPLTEQSDEQTGNDIYAVRLDANGTPIDSTPIIIDQTYGYQRAPKVAWNGQAWLVVYESQDFTGSYYSTYIHAVRVSATGTVLDSPSLLVYGADYVGQWAVASDGNNWCVVSNTNGVRGVVARRISSAGAFLDTPPAVLLPPTASYWGGITLNSARGEYLLTYQDFSPMHARRFNGATLAPVGAQFDVPSNQIASNGNDYFVIFYNAGNQPAGSRLTYTGTLLDPAGVPITDGTRSAFESDITWSGTYWWYTWIDGFVGVLAARITPANQVLDFNGVALDPATKDTLGMHHVAGRPDGGAQLVFHDHRLTAREDYDVATASFSTAMARTAPATISSGAPSQRSVDIVHGPNEFFVAYSSQVDGVMRILAQRLDRNGVAIDATPIEVASGALYGTVRAAWNGSLYLVVWADSSGIKARRLDSNLTLVDAAPIAVMPGWSPDAAALGETFLVTSVHSPTYPQFRSVFARRLDGKTGKVLDSASIPLGGTYASLPRVESFGNRWFVAFQNNYTHDDPQGQVLGAWVAPNGTTPGSFNVTYNGFQPALAISGQVALIASRRNSAANANNDIQAVRMSLDGTILDAPFTVSAATGRQTYPTAAWDGANFFVSWQDQRNQAVFFDNRTDIYAAQINTDGQVLDTDGFVIAAGAIPEMQPAIASGGGDTLIGVSTFRPDTALVAYRIGVYHANGTFTDPPHAAFNATPTAGCIPLVAQFTDRTTGSVDSWDWSFGDGGSSSVQNPAHTYSTAGIYSVAMTAGSNRGFDSAARIDYIVAAAPSQALFSAAPTTTCAPLEAVAFTDQSIGFPSSWIWDFGDGTYSTEQHPRHVYQWPGSYTVTETVRGSCGTNTVTKTNLITVNPPCGYKAYAKSDLSVASSLAGDYTRTLVEDNLWEVMYEVAAGSGSGSYTQLDHRWDFDVPAGASVTFHARTYRNNPFYSNDFRFQYSTDNVTFQPLINSVPVGYKSFTVPMPATLSGHVWIRVIDTTHTPGTIADSLYVDYMDIYSDVRLPPRPVGTIGGLAFNDKTRMQWSAATSATHYDVTRGDLATLLQNRHLGDGSCRKDDQAGLTWSDAELPLPGQGFYYVLRGDAHAMSPGTYDSAGAPPAGAEGRDAEIGGAGGTRCTQRP